MTIDEGIFGILIYNFLDGDFWFVNWGVFELENDTYLIN